MYAWCCPYAHLDAGSVPHALLRIILIPWSGLVRQGTRSMLFRVLQYQLCLH